MTFGSGRVNVERVIDFGTAAGTPRIRLRAPGGHGTLDLKLEHLLPSGSVYDRIAGPLIQAAQDRAAQGAESPGPFLVAGCGSACLSFAAAAVRAKVPIELVLPGSTLAEHRRLLAQHRVKLHEAPGTSLLSATAHAEALAAGGGGTLIYAPGRPELARAVWAKTLVAELEVEQALDPGPRPVIFLPSGLSDLAEALATGFSTRRVSSDGGSSQDGAFEAGEHPSEARVTDVEAVMSRRRLATEEGLLLGYATSAAVHAAREALAGQALSAALVVALDAGDRYFSYDGRFGGAGPRTSTG